MRNNLHKSLAVRLQLPTRFLCNSGLWILEGYEATATAKGNGRGGQMARPGGGGGYLQQPAAGGTLNSGSPACPGPPRAPRAPPRRWTGAPGRPWPRWRAAGGGGAARAPSRGLPGPGPQRGSCCCSACRTRKQRSLAVTQRPGLYK